MSEYTGVSQVKLNGIPLDIDPDRYTMLGGRRRGSVHKIIDGGTVYQDRGFDASDMSIILSGSLTDVTTLKALFAVYRKTGFTFTFEDFKENSFEVCFTPGNESFLVEPIKGSNRAYSYQILLSVVSVNTWLGDEDGLPSTT
jgi:hypothetical protein